MPRDQPIISDGSARPDDRSIFWIVFIAAAIAGAGAAIYYARLDLTLSHYDARAHLVVARRLIDNLTPGWRQLGAVWLPLPHLLNAPLAQWDWAYRTGAIAVAMSIVAMAWGLASAGVFVRRHTASRLVAIVTPLLVLSNPDVLYLQASPMTEPLLIGLSFAALTAVDAWIAAPATGAQRRAGWLLAALVLTRYEGWFIAAGMVLIAAIATARQRRSFREVLTLAWYPALAIVAFLFLSRTSTGSWFTASGFFIPENPALGQPLAAFEDIRDTTRTLAGPVIWTAGLAGIAVCIWRTRLSTGWLLPMSLLLAALLPLLAFQAGHPHRVRYMVPLVAAGTLFAGLATRILPRLARPIAIVGLLAATLFVRPPLATDAPMVREAQRESPKRQGRAPVTQYLASAHDDSPILASMGSLAHYMHELSSIGLSLSDFVHEGNGDLWSHALRSPAQHVRWILIEEEAEGGDMLAVRARGEPQFLAGFTRAASGGGLALYRRE